MKVDVIVSCRVANAKHRVPGSLTANCTLCGELVLMSPSTLEIRKDNPDSRVLCMKCALPLEGGEIMELTPAQLKEIEDWRQSRVP